MANGITYICIDDRFGSHHDPYETVQDFLDMANDCCMENGEKLELTEGNDGGWRDDSGNVVLATSVDAKDFFVDRYGLIESVQDGKWASPSDMADGLGADLRSHVLPYEHVRNVFEFCVRLWREATEL